MRGGAAGERGSALFPSPAPAHPAERPQVDPGPVRSQSSAPAASAECPSGRREEGEAGGGDQEKCEGAPAQLRREVRLQLPCPLVYFLLGPNLCPETWSKLAPQHGGWGWPHGAPPPCNRREGAGHVPKASAVLPEQAASDSVSCGCRGRRQLSQTT